MDNFLKYFIIGVAVTIIVDYTTAFSNNFQTWLSYMPDIWLVYTGYPLIFAFLTQKKKWSDRRVFIAASISGFVLELTAFSNVMLVVFPMMLIAIPAVIVLYSLVTLWPKWMVEKKVTENRKKLIPLVVVWIIISISTFTGGG